MNDKVKEIEAYLSKVKDELGKLDVDVVKWQLCVGKVEGGVFVECSFRVDITKK